MQPNAGLALSDGFVGDLSLYHRQPSARNLPCSSVYCGISVSLVLVVPQEADGRYAVVCQRVDQTIHQGVDGRVEWEAHSKQVHSKHCSIKAAAVMSCDKRWLSVLY